MPFTRDLRAEFRAKCAFDSKIEFVFELDFSRVDPCRANVSVNDSQLRQKEQACFSKVISIPWAANRSALVHTLCFSLTRHPWRCISLLAAGL